MSNYGESLVMPADSSKPDLGSLRIHEGQRAKSGMGRRVLYASIPVVIFGAIVAAAFALREQKPVVEVATAAKPDAERPQRPASAPATRSEEHTSELQSRGHLVCRLLLEKKKTNKTIYT